MAYTMTTVAVKPANVQWWNQVDAAGANRYANFVRTFPGVTSYTGGADGSDKWRTAIVFTNQAAYDAFVGACATNADWVARKAYNEANNILATFTYA